MRRRRASSRRRSRCCSCKPSCCRSRSKREAYAAVNNQLVDRRSKQLLYNDFDMMTMGRTRLKSHQMFNESTANSLLPKHMKKKGSSGRVNFLVDRMRFERGCCNCCCRRRQLNYREIKETYTFPSQPNAFMLGVQEEKSGKRYLETYACNNRGDVDRVQQLLQRTANDPEHLLRSTSVNNVNSAYYPPVEEPIPTERSTMSAATQADFISMDQPSRPVTRYTSPIPYPTPPTTVKKPAMPEVPIVYPQKAPDYWTAPNATTVIQYEPTQMQAQNPPTLEHVVPVRSYSPVYKINKTPVRSEPVPQYYNLDQPFDFRTSNCVVSVPGTPKLRARSASFDRSQIVSMNPNDVTFLNPNEVNGPEIVDRGSVYMYVAREMFHDPTVMVS